MLTAAGVMTALTASLVVTWPLVFAGEVRVNLGWIWVFYVFLGIGVAAVILAIVGQKYAPAVILATLVGAIVLGPTFRRYEPDTVPFRPLYHDIAGILANAGGNQVIVQFHFMAHFYPDFQIGIKRQGASQLVSEMRTDPTFVEQLPKRLSAYTGAKTIWIVYPYERGPDLWEKVDKLVIPGFVRTSSHRELDSVILKFEKSGASGPSSSENG
jgi:hypothetical protein